MNETINEETYHRLKREVEEAKTSSERAHGALEQLMSQLKKDFNCGNLKEAQTHLAELKAGRDKAAEKFQKTLTDYKEKWKTE